MFYAKWIDENKEVQTAVFTAWKNYHRATFNPFCEELSLIVFKPTGKTYADRKKSVREIAQEFQFEDCGGLSYREYNCVGAWFEKYGKRYGLLREFHENAIC